MLWVFSFLPPLAYYLVILLFGMAALYLFNDDIGDIINDIFGDNHIQDISDGNASFFYEGANFLVPLETGRKKKCWVRYDSTKRELQRVQTKLSIFCTKKQISKSYCLERLEEIRLTSDNLNGREEELAIHLSFGSHSTPLVLVAANEEVRDVWLRELQLNIIKVKPDLCHNANLDFENRVQKTILEVIGEAGGDSNSVVPIDTIQKVLRKFNFNASKSDLKLLISTKKFPKQKTDGLAFQDSQTIIKSILQRRDLCDIFDEYALSTSNYALMSVVDFHKFLTKCQGKDCAIRDTERQLLQHEAAPRSNYLLLSCSVFQAQLNSSCLALKPEALNLQQPLNFPLTDYFISSSHNTYLLEDQLKGRSDCVAYENALKKNCRCVELDIHNGSNGDPIITHGGTMTTKIRFEDVIKTIAKYAFVASPYPVILSFENHTSLDQQKKVVEYLEEHLGEMLYRDENADEFEKLPSPEELKHKIIIKNKKLPPNSFETMSEEGEAFAVVEEEFEEEGEGAEIDESASLNDIAIDDESIDSQSTTSTGVSRKKSSASKGPNLMNFVSSKLSKPKKIELFKELSDMVTICRAVKFKGCQYARDHYKCTEMSSLVESKLSKKQWTGDAAETGNDFVKHTQYQLARIYPMGLRTNSSNYNPCTGWVLGCQLVALNYQTPGAYMDLNDGLFQLKGSTGYVLKPALIRDTDTTFDPFGPFDPSLARRLDLTIISAFNLKIVSHSSQEDKDKQIAPTVKASLYGVAEDEKKDQTKRAEYGINPQWNFHCFTDNNIVHVPDLAHLRLEVKDKNSSKVVGQFSAPLTAYNEGYRIINLKDYKGNPLSQSQLVIKLKLSPVSLTSAANSTNHLNNNHTKEMDQVPG